MLWFAHEVFCMHACTLVVFFFFTRNMRQIYPYPYLSNDLTDSVFSTRRYLERNRRGVLYEKTFQSPRRDVT